MDLNWRQRLQLRILGYASVGYRMKTGWKGPIEHFAFKCEKHGLVENYPMGYKQRLNCPKCLEEKQCARAQKIKKIG